jgi:hypothetical protein
LCARCVGSKVVIRAAAGASDAAAAAATLAIWRQTCQISGVPGRFHSLPHRRVATPAGAVLCSFGAACTERFDRRDFREPHAVHLAALDHAAVH